MRYRWHRLVLRVLPQRVITLVAGAFARSPLSRWMIPWFIKFYHIDTSESERPVQEYACLTEFFSRGLKEGARQVHPDGIISPVDGTVSEFGQVRNGRLLQAKGSHYSLAGLLGSAEDAAHFANGHYITLYLSPRDYHRIHMPVDGEIVRWRYIPGKLFPVNAYGVYHVEGLFTKNERLITFVQATGGRMAVVKVGATIVGSIRTPYGPQRSGGRRRESAVQERQTSFFLRRGEELGRFEFGSTVILVFEPGMVETFVVQTGQTVRMGQQIATLRSPLQEHT